MAHSYIDPIYQPCVRFFRSATNAALDLKRNISQQDNRIVAIAVGSFALLLLIVLACRFFLFQAKWVLNGPCEKIWPNGIKEAGNFVNGVLNGKGKRTYPAKSKNPPDAIIEEEGDFESGLLHGQGKITYQDGRTLIGQFNKNVFVPSPAQS